LRLCRLACAGRSQVQRNGSEDDQADNKHAVPCKKQYYNMQVIGVNTFCNIVRNCPTIHLASIWRSSFP